MKILKLPFFYFAVCMFFSIIMAIRQQINDSKDYYTVVNITYQDNTKDIYKCEGRPNVYLNEWELEVGGNVIKSYVKSFDWNVYKNK